MNFSKKHITIAIIILFLVYINFFRNKENMTNYNTCNRNSCNSTCQAEGFSFGSYMNNTCTCGKTYNLTQSGSDYTFTTGGQTFSNSDPNIVASDACASMHSGSTANPSIRGTMFKCEKVLTSC